MYRKLFITVLMLGIGMVGFSQTNESKADPKEVAKTAAKNSTEELLDRMSLKLKDKNAQKPHFGNAKEQFLYQENLIDSVLKLKDHSLKAVFNKLCGDLPTEFIFERVNVDTNNIKYKEIQRSHKNQSVNIDSTIFIVPISFEAHTIARNGVSDVKYKITFKWEVKVDEKEQKVVVDGKKTEEKEIVFTSKKLTLISSEANPVTYLTSDRENMRQAAKKAIIEWYKNLPQTLDKKYADQAITDIDPIEVSYNDISCNLPQGQEFAITNVKDIKVNIDPWQFINDKSLYTNPTASITVSPAFTVHVDDSFTSAKIINVAYEEQKSDMPITDPDKVVRRDTAKAFVEEFAQQLSSYVASRDAEQKAVVESMFDATESVVEVSYLPKRGKEQIKNGTAQSYLSLLKGSALHWTWNDDDVELEDSNWNTLIYTVNQDYESKTYSDQTQKRIHLKYDDGTKSYRIDKIEVVPNTTIKK